MNQQDQTTSRCCTPNPGAGCACATNAQDVIASALGGPKPFGFRAPGSRATLSYAGAAMTHTTDVPDPELRGLSPEVAQHLVASHAQFLAFLQRRVGSRELAEELLQDAFVRALSRGESLRDGEAATAWFYRLLRNALIDHYRRRGVERRAIESEQQAVRGERAAASDLDEELMGAVCGCVRELIDTLKPEYAQALRQVDLDEHSVSDYAAAAGITSNNAGVRLHRARQALFRSLVRSCGTCATHGCLDCRCEPSHAPGAKSDSFG